jgi:hypothetical protein
MRAALSKLGISGSEACILGDRMDTDILAGIQSEIRTVLVLTGVTSLEDLPLFPYRPDCILPSVGHVLQDGCEVLLDSASQAHQQPQHHSQPHHQQQQHQHQQPSASSPSSLSRSANVSTTPFAADPSATGPV